MSYKEDSKVKVIVKYLLENRYRVSCYHSYDIMDCKACYDKAINYISATVSKMMEELPENTKKMTEVLFLRTVCNKCRAHTYFIDSCYKWFHKTAKQGKIVKCAALLVEVALTRLVGYSILSFSTRGKKSKMLMYCPSSRKKYPSKPRSPSYTTIMPSYSNVKEDKRAHIYKGD